VLEWGGALTPCVIPSIPGSSPVKLDERSSSSSRPRNPFGPRAPARRGETAYGSGQVCPSGGRTVLREAPLGARNPHDDPIAKCRSGSGGIASAAIEESHASRIPRMPLQGLLGMTRLGGCSSGAAPNKSVIPSLPGSSPVKLDERSCSSSRPSTPSGPRAPARRGETACGSGQVCPSGGRTVLREALLGAGNPHEDPGAKRLAGSGAFASAAIEESHASRNDKVGRVLDRSAPSLLVSFRPFRGAARSPARADDST